MLVYSANLVQREGNGKDLEVRKKYKPLAYDFFNTQLSIDYLEFKE